MDWHADRLLAGVLRGWRVWRYKLDSEELRPSFFLSEAVWPPGVAMKGHCTDPPLVGAENHIVPADNCWCGMHAFKERERAYHDWEDLMDGAAMYKGAIPVYGEVSVWGNVYEHEWGWRASRAYPYSVKVPADINQANAAQGRPLVMYDAQSVANSIRLIYGVDAEVIHG